MILPKCPRCRIDLKREWLPRPYRVLRYHCPSCQGNSYSLAALKKIVDSDFMRSYWARSRQDEKKSQLDCPHCLKKMGVVKDFSNTSVEVDTCRRCYTLWLDFSEAEAFPLNRKTETKAKVMLPDEAYQLLARAKVQAIQEQLRRPPPFEQASVSFPQGMVAILGFPIEERNGSLQRTPYVTYNVMVLCIVVSFVGFHYGAENIFQFGFHSSQSLWNKCISLWTSFFFHGGYIHLIFNMYFLWVFGDNAEDELGHLNFALLLTFGHLAGLSAFTLFNPSNLPTVGASAGIAAAVAFYLLRFPYRRFIIFFFFRFIAIGGWIFGILHVLPEFFKAYLESKGGSSGVAHTGHVGGYLVGLVFFLLLRPSKKDH